MKLNIAHLFPDLLNLYGDKGNIAALKKRLEWRNIEVEVKEYKIGEKIDFENTDIILLGGGSDREQLTVLEYLSACREKLVDYIENGGVLLAICGGFELFGKYSYFNNVKTDCLDVLDIYTEAAKTRFTENVIIKTDFFERPIVGFENHSGRTYINDLLPLGTVVCGSGNNGEDKTEGVMYKNVIGTNLHGPLLPKNPHLCDYIIKKALQNKFGEIELKDLDDSIEIAANDYIVNRFGN